MANWDLDFSDRSRSCRIRWLVSGRPGERLDDFAYERRFHLATSQERLICQNRDFALNPLAQPTMSKRDSFE